MFSEPLYFDPFFILFYFHLDVKMLWHYFEDVINFPEKKEKFKEKDKNFCSLFLPREDISYAQKKEIYAI